MGADEAGTKSIKVTDVVQDSNEIHIRVKMTTQMGELKNLIENPVPLHNINLSTSDFGFGRIGHYG